MFNIFYTNGVFHNERTIGLQILNSMPKYEETQQCETEIDISLSQGLTCILHYFIYSCSYLLQTNKEEMWLAFERCIKIIHQSLEICLIISYHINPNYFGNKEINVPITPFLFLNAYLDNVVVMITETQFQKMFQIYFHLLQSVCIRK